MPRKHSLVKKTHTSGPKLDYVLLKLDKALVFQVLKQSAAFISRPDSEEQLVFEVAERFQIVSGKESPSIVMGDGKHPTKIFLRGSDWRTYNHPSVIYCFDNRVRNMLFSKVQAALRLWAENAFEQPEAEEEIVEDISGRFTL